MNQFKLTLILLVVAIGLTISSAPLPTQATQATASSTVFNLSTLVASMTPVAATATPAPQDIHFPDLTGPYKVGRTSYEWVDSSRSEPFGSDSNARRDLTVWVWYPAAPDAEGKPAAYMDNGKLWDLWSNHPGREHFVHTHALTGVSISADRANYPVIIFSPGLHGISLNYASIIEDLVSHGYVVVGTNHPYSTTVIEYPDGRLVFTSNAGETANARLVEIWTADVHFILDQLEKQNSDDASPFKGKFDFTRVGMMGHSWGGTTANAVCRTEPRVEACINLDGPDAGQFIGQDKNFAKPYLLMNGEYGSYSHENEWWLLINNAAHLNYGDFGLLIPLIPETSNLNLAEPRLALTIINDYIFTFFEIYLNYVEKAWPAYPDVALVLAKKVK